MGVLWLMLVLTCLYSGCFGGRAARWVAAWRHHFSTVNTAGRRNAQMSSELVGAERRVPVMAIVPDLWMVVNCLSTLLIPVLLGP